VFKPAAHAFLSATGWRLRNDTPPGLDKFVVIGAPHTSNWDFPFCLAAAAALDLEFFWLGKRELFDPPFGGLMQKLGGIPVDRSGSQNLVEQLPEEFRRHDRMALGIPPEGTRSRGTYWKSGFYYIARDAGVPIVCGTIDYARREVGLGRVLDPNRPLGEVMDAIRRFYSDKKGLYPDQFTPPRLRQESGTGNRER